MWRSPGVWFFPLQFVRRSVALLHCIFMSRQRLGQHFLSDSGWQQRILATLPLQSGDCWIEIGAGHGEMTHLLAGGERRVIAIETDPALAASLRGTVEANPAEWPRVEIVNADVLAVDLAHLGTGPFRVYGNLPYYITSPILRRLFVHADRISSIHIVIQLEVAERIVAQPCSRAYGYLSTLCQLYTQPEIVLRLPPGAFRPPPKVTSALVRMVLPGKRFSLGIPPKNESRFLEFIQTCFSQKRKTLRNNLRPFVSPGKIQQTLSACGLRADSRAEQLTLEQFALLFAELQ
jgi:16S rRNA (adenine1518-N6/adenine1519-N6)-dimethyltransferase